MSLAQINPTSYDISPEYLTYDPKDVCLEEA